MINFTNISDIGMVKQGEQKKKVLFKIKGEKQQKIVTQRTPLNLSLVIDVSTSMDDSIGKSIDMADANLAMNFLNKIKPVRGAKVNGKTKMHQVKEAATKCIDLLENGDFVSIVTFNSAARVVQESIEISDSSKKLLKNKISEIYASGGTNLHDGWLSGGMEVAKKLSSKTINRVLVLTDGETNQGITNPKTIAETVEGLAKRGISTTTFGVGDQYNEDLLEKMATVSGGNSYYIEDESKVVSILTEEFACLNNVVADSATLEFVGKKGFSVTCLNELDYVDKKFVIGNIISNKEVTVLLEFSFNNKQSLGEVINLGNVNFSFTNSEGKIETQTIELSYATISDADFDSQKVNEEINIQTTILDIAKQQKVAKEHMKAGDRETAYDILRKSVTSAQLFAGDARVGGEINQINTLMAESENYSDMKMSKMLSSMSYSTRNSKRG